MSPAAALGRLLSRALAAQVVELARQTAQAELALRDALAAVHAELDQVRAEFAVATVAIADRDRAIADRDRAIAVLVAYRDADAAVLDALAARVSGWSLSMTAPASTN